jgi:hypothetical protein
MSSLWLSISAPSSACRCSCFRRSRRCVITGAKSNCWRAALGIVLFSGAFQLTALKAVYREAFVRQLGYILGMKLLFAFFLVIFSVYQAMGIAHRFVRRHEAAEPVSPQELASVIRRLHITNACILVLAVITLWLGVALGLRQS